MNMHNRAPLPAELPLGDSFDTATLVAFSPVEPGWVRADLDRHHSEPGRPVYYVSPVTGWAHLETDDGQTWLLAVDHHGQWDPDGLNSLVLYSRNLFRQAQGGEILLTRKALLERVSESGA